MKPPNLFAAFVGALISVIGLIGVVAPSFLIEFGQSLQTLGALYLIAVIRIVFGATLLWVASRSRVPVALRAFGVVAIATGLLAPLFGVERFHAMFDWFAGQGPLFARIWASAGIVFGLLIVYAVSTPRRKMN